MNSDSLHDEGHSDMGLQADPSCAFSVTYIMTSVGGLNCEWLNIMQYPLSLVRIFLEPSIHQDT